MSTAALAALLLAAPFRLPNAGTGAGATGDFTRPSHYDLKLRVVPADGAFSGEETIQIDVQGHPAAVILHAADLTIGEAKIEQAGKTQVALVVPRAENETVALQPPLPLAPGPATLRLMYSAKLRDDLRGLYLVKTKSGDLYAVSQFEATDARRAFPCYDEPAFKASFSVTAEVPAGMTAVSNGAVQDDRPAADAHLHVVTFAPTPPISSYLVALAVGKFAAVEADVPASQNHTHIRVLAPAGQERLGKFALQMAVKALPWYERTFGIPFPYAKLDMVAVPDFDAGGMENAGAIFYRDTALLLDERSASVQMQKRVGVVVVHEMAHQWFGDLVTMAWWDDLWLNEAFASLMEGESLGALKPEWDPWSQIQLDTEDVLVTDSLSASHPIHVPVASAEEANALFDDITYSKGSAVLHMLELYLTPEKWRAGVHAYLTAHALGNASEADLWQALSAASGKDVAKIASSWFDQAGYPLVTIARQSGSVKLSQQPFSVGPAPVPAAVGPAPVPAAVGPAPVLASQTRLWEVPVCIGKPSRAPPDCTLLTTASGSIDLTGAPPWIDANAGFSGFYRVRYARSDWSALEAAFEKAKGKGPSGPERMALLSDASWLAKVDLGNSPEPIDLFLELVSKMSAERDFSVWRMALGELTELDDNLLLEDDQPAFRAFVARQLRPAAKELGWTGSKKETPSRRSLRAAVLGGLTALARDRATIAQAKARLAQFEKSPASLDLTLLPLVLTSAARNGNAALWDRFRAKMDGAKDLELRDRYRAALAEFGDPALIQKTLDLTLTGGMRKQDIPYELGALLENPLARDQTRQFLEQHWGELKNRFSGIAAAWSILPALGSFCSAEAHDELQAFFADPAHHVDGGDRAMKLALERIALCVDFKKYQAAELSRWVGAHAARAK